jgi:two-component system, sporulation sensor kinase E
MDRAAGPSVAAAPDALLLEEARTRRAMLHMLEDVRREREALRREMATWHDTVNAIGWPLVVLDQSSRVLRANQAYADRSGLAVAEVAGRRSWECFPRLGAEGQGIPAQFELGTGEVFAVQAFPIHSGAAPTATLHLFRDVTQSRRADAQMRALVDIAGSPSMLRGEVEAVARQATEAAVRVLRLERASVWLFNGPEDELLCIDLFASGEHASGLVRRASEHAAEFAALKNAPNVESNDSWSGVAGHGSAPDASGMPAAMTVLATVIEVSGKHVGVLHMEQAGRPRRWSAEEIAFACQLADKLAVAAANRATGDANEAIARRERFFHKLIEGSSDAFFLLDASGTFRYRSESGVRLTGYETAEVIGRGLDHFLPPNSADAARREFATLAARAGGEAVIEVQAIHKNGSVMTVEAHGKNLLQDPDVNGIVVTLRDLTQRKLAEAALRDSEHRFRSIADCAQDGIAVMDDDGRIVFWNAAAERMFGYPAQAAVGQQLHELVAPARYRDDYIRGLAQFRGSGQGAAIGRRNELTARRSNGEEFATDLSLSAYLAHDGWHAVGIVRDVTDQKMTERALRESDERFRAIFDNTRDGIFLMSLEPPTIQFANPAMEALLGYGRGELLGLPMDRLHPAEVLGQVSQQFRNAVTGGPDIIDDMLMAKKDGSPVYVDLAGVRVVIGGTTVMLGAFRDATRRREDEARLRAQLGELQRWQNLNLDREDRILDLKREINEVLGQGGQPARYPSAQ